MSLRLIRALSGAYCKTERYRTKTISLTREVVNVHDGRKEFHALGRAEILTIDVHVYILLCYNL